MNETSPPRPAFTIPAGWMLAALGLGLLIGALIAARFPAALPMAEQIATPVGQLWLDALTMTIVPLVFGLIVTGITAAARTASANAVAGKAIGWFAALLLLTAIGGALTTELFVTLLPLSVDAGAFDVTTAGPVPIAEGASWFFNILPSNPVRAAADMAMLPLVLFALLFGFAATRVAPDRRAPVEALLAGTVDIMLVLVRWVLLVAPVGIFALALLVGARTGGSAVGTLFHYVAAVSLACLSAAVLAAGAALIVTRTSPLTFFRAVLPAQAVALGTQSSLATLPAMLAAATRLGIPTATSGLVLPLAVSLFRAASAAGNVAVAVYLAHLHGLPPGPAILLLGALVSAAISLAAVGLPSHVSFFTAIAPVCLAMGVPVVMLPILLAIETIPDLFRTLGNVTADLAVTRIVARDG